MKKLLPFLTLFVLAGAFGFLAGQTTNSHMVITPSTPITTTVSSYTVSSVLLNYSANTVVIYYNGIGQTTTLSGAQAAPVLNAFATANLSSLQTYIKTNPPQ